MLSIGEVKLHLACKEIIVAGIYQTFDDETAAFAMKKLGFLRDSDN
jgi:hypothetical protein